MSSYLRNQTEEINALLKKVIQRKINDQGKGTVGSDEAKTFDAELQSMKSRYGTAVMIEKMSNTPFVSTERFLNPFIRARPALMKFVGTNSRERAEFEQKIYKASANRVEKATN